MKRRQPRVRRALLASLALLALALPAAAPAFTTGCAAGFAPISQLVGLRVLAVAADQPYAQPGDTVTFTMTYDDTYGRPPPEIVWVGGCYDPPGGDYYGCYAQLEGEFKNLASGVTSGLVGLGPTYPLTLSRDILQKGQSSGLAYVFFAACAGTIKPVPPQGTGLAGSFPVGCFDDQGNLLGADSFVPGYTQIYAFADGRTDHNPAPTGISIGGAPLPPGPCVPTAAACGKADDGGGPDPAVDGGLVATPACCAVLPCSVAEDTRLTSGGCGKGDPFNTCATDAYSVSVDVPADVGEYDPSFPKAARQTPYKAVWVDYFADQGDFDSAVLLVNDATEGLQAVPNYAAHYIPPPLDADAGNAPIDVTIWAVVHDSLGGEAVVQRSLRVEP